MDDGGGGFAGHEGEEGLFAVGVAFAVSGHEFAKVGDGFAFGVGGADLVEMFEHDAALFGQRRGRRGLAALVQGADLPEYPGVADGAAGDDDAVDAGVAETADGGFGAEDVAGTEDGEVGEAFFDFGDAGPVGLAAIFLDDGAAVDGEHVDAVVGGVFADRPEVGFGGGTVVITDADFHEDGGVDEVAGTAECFADELRLLHEIAAAGTPQDLGGRAGEVEVDEVVADLDEAFGGPGHGLRILAENLGADGVLGGDGLELELVEGFMVQGDLVEHDAGEGQRAAELFGQDPHGVVGIPAQRSLNERHIKLYRAECQHWNPWIMSKFGIFQQFMQKPPGVNWQICLNSGLTNVFSTAIVCVLSFWGIV